MEDKETAATHLFTVRVWMEALGEGKSEWRGQVRYVTSGESYYFREWAQLREMLGRCLPGFDLAADVHAGRVEQARGVTDQE